MPSYRLGLIGAGNMAEAIVRGTLGAKVLPPEAITAADPSPERRRLFHDELGVAAVEDNLAVVRRSDVIILAVKPQMMEAVMAQVGPALGGEKLAVSIAAGVTLARLAKFCPPGARLIRAMPNTPMLVGRGMVALSRGANATDKDVTLVRELFASCAKVVEVPEEKMDAVTAVSGSGPAYFFYLVEALIEAGVAVGLSHQEAVKLAETTFVGAAELLASSAALGPAPASAHAAVGAVREPPAAAASPAAALRRRVTSPGGTTAAALAALEADKFNEIIARAVRAARDRSRELGR